MMLFLLLMFSFAYPQVKWNSVLPGPPDSPSIKLDGIYNITNVNRDLTFTSRLKRLTFVGVTSFILFSSDGELNEEYGLEKEYTPLGIPKIMGNLGNLYDQAMQPAYAMGITASVYSAGVLFKNEKLVSTIHIMGQSLLLTSLVNTYFKMMIGRARPYVADDPRKFKPFNFGYNADYMSMPSGHTASVFALMTVVAKQYDSWYVDIPAYTFAASVGFQRVNTRKHWTSDLIVGGTIGYLIGSMVAEHHLKDSFLRIFNPQIDRNGVGLVLHF